jgi:L-lactate dehydrogenase complex protein LldG
MAKAFDHSTSNAPPPTRENFIRRMQEAMGRPVGVPTLASPPPQVNENMARLARPTDDLVTMFCKRAEVSGMKVYRLKSTEVNKQILALLEEAKAQRIVVGVGTLPQGLPLKEAIRKKGMEVVDWAATPSMDCQFDANVGITDVHAALAETGTMICCSDSGHSRGLSLIPPIHIAIVRKSDILPDMFDYWARYKGVPSDKMPSSIAFITGPSKTADLEGILITGVHGPGKVHVVVADDV